MHKTIRILTLVAAMIVGAGETWAEDVVNYCGKSDVNDGKNLVWYVTEGTDGVKTLHIEKNPDVTDANADFSMADYDNNDANVEGNFAPWIQPNDAGNGSDGLRYGITAVAIGADVTSIGNKAFNGCVDLKTVTFESDGNSIPTLGNGIFDGCNLKAIFVPSVEAYAAYKAAADGWDQTVNDRPLKSYLAPATISVVKNKSGWSTYCHNYGVAYSLADGNTGDNAPKVYTVSGLSADGKSVNTKQVDGNLVIPGTPLLLNYNYSDTDDEITMTANVDEEVTPSDNDIISQTGDGWAFIGNAGSDLASDADALKDIIHIVHNDNDKSGIASYVLSGSDFVIVNENSGLKAHRCLLNVSSGTASSARRLSIARGGETTGTSTPEPTYGNIYYYYNVFYNNKPNAYGGWLQFYKDADCQISLPINTVSGLTDGIVYIKATPDNLHTLKGFLPEVEKCSESGSAQSRNRSLRVNVGVPIEVTAVDGKTGVYQFTMPADGSNVVVSMAFPDKDYETKVKYLTWNDTNKKLEETTTGDNTKVYILDGTETELEGGWYIAKSDIDLSKYGGIELKGNVHLILADKAAMTCSGIKDDGTGSLDLTIHGQSTGDDMGKLTATNASGRGIEVGYLTINGGIVEATTNDNQSSSINVNALTIYGGRVRATNTTSSDYCILGNSFRIFGGHVETSEKSQYGIYEAWDVEIYGGQVEAAGTKAGIYYETQCTFDWTDPDNDYIKVSGIKKGNKTAVDVSADKRFVAYNPVGEGETELAASGIISGTISDQSAIAGKTLRPLDGYYVKDLAGLTFSGKTDADGKPKPDFTITTGTPAVTTPYYIYKAGAVGIVTPDYGHDGVEISGTNVPDDIGVNDTRTLATFQMPANDVTVTDMKFFAEDVAYMDWNESTKTLKSAVAPKAYILTGGGLTTLDGGWYVVTNWNTAADGDGHSPDAAYTSLLQFNGATHLILADGAEMSVDILDSDTQGFGYAIFVKNSDLATLDIYGQALGTGALTAKSARFHAIYLRSTNSGSKSNLTINGGKVSATCSTSNDGIFVCGGDNCTASVIINGGEVTTASDRANAINAYSGNASVTITGGQVEASGNNGIKTNGDITLNLTNGSDFIKASSYEADGSVKIPAGKALACTIGEYTTVMGSNDADYIFDDTGNTTIEYINGQTLVVAKPLPDAAGKSYIAYCSDNGNWILNNTNAKVYVVIGYNLATGQVILKEVTGNLTDEIPNGVPVIIGGASLSDLWLVGEEKLSDGAAGSISGGRLANFFVSDGATTVADLLAAALGSTADLSDYVLFTLVNDGFKPVIATATSTPVKGTCLLAIPKADLLNRAQGGSEGTSGARTLSIELGGDATGIRRPTPGPSLYGGEWYDLQGRRLNGRPTAKGIYIHNGHAVVVQ